MASSTMLEAGVVAFLLGLALFSSRTPLLPANLTPISTRIRIQLWNTLIYVYSFELILLLDDLVGP